MIEQPGRDPAGVRRAGRHRRAAGPEGTSRSLTGTAATFFDAMSITIFSPGSGQTRSGWLWACILGAAVLFMSLPAINLVNINLSRILERAPEIGVRKAFGATSRTLVGQFVVENVVPLTLVGGLLGWALSAVVLRGIVASAVIPYATPI